MNEFCTYCGELATDREHVMPRLWGGTKVVPSCSECNTLAQSEPFFSVEEKRAFIQAALAKKYRKVLAMPDWTEEELSELGPELRNHVTAVMALKERTKIRLNWED